VFAPSYWGVLLGVLVFELSYVLDCADGMLARWRGIQSVRGHLLDFLMDEIKAFVILAAVSVRLYLDHAHAGFLLLGIVGLVCLATGIAITTFQRRPEIAPPAAPANAVPASPSPAKRAIALIERVAKFFIHYPSYILYAALFGRLELYFLPYIAVNALYAARAWLSVALRFGRE
jgi:phosphatidylglycerophosphate synthase